MYYLGWTLGKTVPWYNSIGVAELSQVGMLLLSYSTHQSILGPSQTISYLILTLLKSMERISYIMARIELGGFYIRQDHVLKIGTTEDGLSITRRTKLQLLQIKENTHSQGLTSFVIHGTWSMYYSYRGEMYRIGYAESEDGLEWNRMDEHAGISPSESGWDSENDMLSVFV